MSKENVSMLAGERKSAGWVGQRIKQVRSISEPAAMSLLALTLMLGGSSYIPFLVTSLETEDLNETAEGFEQWAIQYPAQASTVMNAPADFSSIAYVVTGESAESRSIDTVQYLPHDDGSYDLCFIPLEKHYNTYVYSSTTGDFNKEKECEGND